MNKRTKIGIIGCGWIAEKMAITLQGMEKVEAYAIASRSMTKAKDFADKWRFTKAYGSYEEMLDDEQVELVYIATPHSHHFEHTRLSLLKGKPVLCEKAFTANAWQAEELLSLAKEKGIFLTEAIWTRYMPLSKTISELLEKGVIGKPQLLTANLSYPNYNRERMYKPELAGGALLDLGVYTLNFAAMAFGTDIVRTTSSCILSDTGVDKQNSITLEYADGKMAVLCSSLTAKSDRQGIISGDKGIMIVENINNPQSVRVYNNDDQLQQEILFAQRVNGYEYEFEEMAAAFDSGLTQTQSMPLAQTLAVMRLCDALRAQWGVQYPVEMK